ncbi:peptide chain release factor 2 [Buchnera aphidicola (Tuberolachnus salignus)]|nr:peptide chain release factor 2 [Buchnera aphidicola]
MSLLRDKKNILFLLKKFKHKICIHKEKKIILFNQKIQDINDWTAIFLKDSDINILKEIKILYQDLNKNVKKIEKYIMFSNQYDQNNCYVDIQSGSGGIESQDWSKILLKMYIRWAAKKKLKSKIIQETCGEITGLKSVTLKITGKYAFGWFRTETGIHRLVRKSPFDTGNRRHTSFSSVFVYPSIKKNTKINLNPNDLRIDVYRSSGAGGQHVNRTESAVRITHIPTGITTQCQNDRSQHKNKNIALKQLYSKLYNVNLKKEKDIKKKINKNKLTIRWGNQIRSYILDSSRIKDIQTGIETSAVNSVLNGNLQIFVETNLKKNQGKKN